MTDGERVHVRDGTYEVYSAQRTTFPSYSTCLQLDIDGRRGLTPFLTDRDVQSGDEVYIKDMKIQTIQVESEE